MDKLTIRTNRVPRDILQWWDLSAKEQSEFVDYLDTDEKQFEAQFVRYKNWIYDLGEFSACSRASQMPVEFLRWHGYASDSYFSGILIRYVDNFERVICATYFS